MHMQESVKLVTDDPAQTVFPFQRLNTSKDMVQLLRPLTYSVPPEICP